MNKRASRGEMRPPRDDKNLPGKENVNKPNAPLPPKPQAEKKDFGKVPKYLQKYKADAEVKAQEVAKKKEEAELLKHQPAGTKMMAEDQRIEMLKDLNENKKKVTELLAKMPISMASTTVKRQKDELEKKLLEIERAIEVMSRKVVYVRD